MLTGHRWFYTVHIVVKPGASKTMFKENFKTVKICLIGDL